jgi:hypothetical protein
MNRLAKATSLNARIWKALAITPKLTLIIPVRICHDAGTVGGGRMTADFAAQAQLK